MFNQYWFETCKKSNQVFHQVDVELCNYSWWFLLWRLSPAVLILWAALVYESPLQTCLGINEQAFQCFGNNLILPALFPSPTPNPLHPFLYRVLFSLFGFVAVNCHSTSKNKMMTREMVGAKMKLFKQQCKRCFGAHHGLTDVSISVAGSLIRDAVPVITTHWQHPVWWRQMFGEGEQLHRQCKEIVRPVVYKGHLAPGAH